MRPDTAAHAAKEVDMRTPRWRRQDGLIREALYVFLAVALVMAIMLDGLALQTVQQEARDLAEDAAMEAKQEYAQTTNVNEAQAAAERHVAAGDAKLVAFNMSTGGGAGSGTFTVTVKNHTGTYLFKYLGYLPGLDEWVEDMQNPLITRTTE